jgi:hypothetical protein
MRANEPGEWTASLGRSLPKDDVIIDAWYKADIEAWSSLIPGGGTMMMRE